MFSFINFSCIDDRSWTHRPKLLLSGHVNQGQSSHLAPAVLHVMERLPVHTLDLPSLFAVSAKTPEESCSQVGYNPSKTDGESCSQVDFNPSKTPEESCSQVGYNPSKTPGESCSQVDFNPYKTPEESCSQVDFSPLYTGIF